MQGWQAVVVMPLMAIERLAGMIPAHLATVRPAASQIGTVSMSGRVASGQEHLAVCDLPGCFRVCSDSEADTSEPVAK